MPAVLEDIRSHRQDDFSFVRAELLHQMLMEDFDFLSAARSFVGSLESPTFNYADISSTQFLHFWFTFKTTDRFRTTA